MPTSTTRPVQRLNGNDAGADVGRDDVVIEEPLEIRVGGQPLAVTMRTPGHDRQLVAGFCLTEGVIAHADELETVEPCADAEFGNIVDVRLTDESAARRRRHIERARREFYLSSSCGLCGKQSIDRIVQQAPPVIGRFTVARQTLAALPDRMRRAQGTFNDTGGLHAAAAFSPAGELRLLYEDVGRHNAVDKVIGAALLSGQLPLDPAVLLVSGRASFEIMQKAAMAGVALVAAVSAPSSLAIDFAVRLNMTLVGFLREGRMNVYHDAGRIV